MVSEIPECYYSRHVENRPAPTQPDRRRFRGQPEKLLAGYEKAVALGAEFVLAPELFLCGYPPRDLLQRADFIDANLTALAETAKQRRRDSACASGSWTGIPNVPDARCAMPPPFCRTAKSSGARTKACCRPTTFLTRTAILNRRKPVAPFEFNGQQTRHHHLRGHLERRGFLAGTALSPRPGEGTDFAGRGNHPEPLRLAVARRQGADAAGNAPARGARRKNSAGAGQRRRRERRIDFRRPQRRAGFARRSHRAGKRFCGGHFGGGIEPGSSRGNEAQINESEPPHVGCYEFPPREQQLFSALSLGIRDYVRKCGFKSVTRRLVRRH